MRDGGERIAVTGVKQTDIIHMSSLSTNQAMHHTYILQHITGDGNK